MTLIKDPVFGTGARVGADGRLQAWAVSETSEAARSHEGDAFIASVAQGGVRTLTLAAGQTYNLLYVQNDSDRKLMALNSLLVSMDAAGAVLFVVKNPVVGTLGNNTEVTPSNLNFGSTNPADVTAHVWDEVGTAGITGLTAGEEIQSLTLPGMAGAFALNAAVHLARTNGVLIGVQNPTGGAIEATAALRFHMEDIESVV